MTGLVRNVRNLLFPLLVIAALRPVAAQQVVDAEREVLTRAAAHLLKDAPAGSTIAVAEIHTAEAIFAKHGKAIADAVRGTLLPPGVKGARCVYSTDAKGYNVRECRLEFSYVLEPLSVEVTGTSAVVCFLKGFQPYGKPYGQSLRVELAWTFGKWEVTKVVLQGES
jgi:hypothetical protein